MNIGIDVRKLDDYGIGTHIRSVIFHAIHQEKNHRFFLFCDPKHEKKENENIQWIPETSSKYSVREHFSLASHARGNNIELFHSPHYTLPLRLQCKSVVTIHDLIHFKFPDYFPAWKRKAAEFVMRRAAEKADRILTVSKTSKEDLLSFIPEANHKCEVLYNRLPQEWSSPPTDIDLQKLGVPKDFVLYVGNFKRHKSVETLVDAHARIPDAPMLVLIGHNSGIEHSLLEKIFANPRARLLGYADMGLLQNLYSKTMLFVFPSLYEGFGYPPLEAMACGAPVLSSDAPALKEILDNGAAYFQRGNIEELTNEMQSLIGNSELRNSLSERGRKRAKFFMTEASCQRLLEIYRSFSL